MTDVMFYKVNQMHTSQHVGLVQFGHVILVCFLALC